MDDGSRLPIILAIFLLFGAVYFAVAETAFAACSKARLKAASERSEAGAGQALYILNHFEQAISTMLIGTNLCHLFISALVTLFVTRRWGLSAVTVSTILTTLAVFFCRGNASEEHSQEVSGAPGKSMFRQPARFYDAVLSAFVAAQQDRGVCS